MAGTAEAEEKDGAAKGGKNTKLIAAAAVVLLLAGGWFFFVREDANATGTLPPPKAGAVLQLDPITINLAGGHYLKLGMALQVIDGPAHEPSGAKALDLAISQFSGKTVDELSSAAGREKAKQELVARIKLAYAPHDDESHAEPEPKSKSERGAEPEDEHGGPGQLTAEQALEEAEALTAHPEIYDVYFTEFVMQ